MTKQKSFYIDGSTIEKPAMTGHHFQGGMLQNFLHRDKLDCLTMTKNNLLVSFLLVRLKDH
jgi:hypothetical protein